MPASDSSAYFQNYLREIRLYSDRRWNNLRNKQWDNMSTFAFAWGYLEKEAAPTLQEFKNIVQIVEGYDYSDVNTWPKDPLTNQRIPQDEPPWHLYRKAMFDTRQATSIENTRRWKAGEEDVRKITSIERKDRRAQLKRKYGPLTECMTGEKCPSEALENTIHEWKELNRITHPSCLSECTSQEMEWNKRRLQPNKKPRVEILDRNQDAVPTTSTPHANSEATTDVKTIHQLHMALCRLGLALELNDLMDFQVFHEWMQKLMKTVNQDYLLTDRAMTIQECINAHDMLFKILEEETREHGIRKDLTTGDAPLETALKFAMNSLRIERALLPGFTQQRAPKQQPTTKKNEPPADQEGKSKNALKKERIAAAATKSKDKEIADLKSMLGQAANWKRPKGASKGKDNKGKGKATKDKGTTPLPKELNDGNHQGVSADDRRICYPYNMSKGCTDCEPGKSCKRGWHICARKGCKDVHSATACTLPK